MLICNVVGARPNFMKMAPVIHALAARGVPQVLVHTGQHYDAAMSQVFFDELGLPAPDIFLGVGSDSHARQTAKILTAFDEVCEQRRPSIVVVAGDVNSTLACALVSAKRNIPVAHVEAGLRSRDRTMPEEVNRVLTDHLSDFLFTSEPSGAINLHQEGIAADKIHFVGNCMVDTLVKHRAAAVARAPWKARGLTAGQYVLVTLHRPANVDAPEKLGQLMAAIDEIAGELPVLFPVHPRTRDRLAAAAGGKAQRVRFCDPLPYIEFLGLMAEARLVLTDSGGVQEETTALQVPCVTLRANTERPVTLTQGTNRLIGDDPRSLRDAVRAELAGPPRRGTLPEHWDGAAAPRIAAILDSALRRGGAV